MSSVLWIVIATGWAQAPASTPLWGLSWKAPAECLQPAELVDLVEEKLRRPVFGANPEFRIDGLVKAQKGSPRWKAKLTLVDASGAVLGSRDVTTDDKNCHSLDASVALVAAVMIDPKAAMMVGTSESAPSVRDPAPKVEEPIVEQIAPRPDSKPYNRVSSTSSARGMIGVRAGQSPLPFPSLGGVLAVLNPLSTNWAFVTRVPIYPYVPIQGESKSAVAFGTGLGFDVSWVSTSLLDSKGKWLVGAGAEGLWVASFEPLGSWLRVDAMGRLGHWVAWGSSGLLIQLEAGYCPFVPTFRMVTPDGRPDDVTLGAPVRWGVEVGWAF